MGYGQRIASIFCAATAIMLPALSGAQSQEPESAARACLKVVDAANQQKMLRSLQITNQCDRAVALKFSWTAQEVPKGAAPCVDRTEETVINPKATYRTSEASCRSYMMGVNFQSAMGAASCIQPSQSSSGPSRAIVMLNKCDRPVQVFFEWKGEMKDANGISTPCSGKAQTFLLQPNESKPSTESRCNRYSVAAGFPAAANPNAPRPAAPIQR